MIYIGALIKAELQRQERSVAWFAKKLRCSRIGVYRIFNKQSIDTQLLNQISLILNHDFFTDLSIDLHQHCNKIDTQL